MNELRTGDAMLNDSLLEHKQETNSTTGTDSNPKGKGMTWIINREAKQN